jgi:hypothetical protein
MLNDQAMRMPCWTVLGRDSAPGKLTIATGSYQTG